MHDLLILLAVVVFLICLAPYPASARKGPSLAERLKDN